VKLEHARAAALHDGKTEVKTTAGWIKLSEWRPYGKRHRFGSYSYEAEYRMLAAVAYAPDVGNAAIVEDVITNGIGFGVWRVR
jgi:hypothetical protein